MEIQTLYQEAIKFATAKHLEENQKLPGTDLPYVVHLSNVAMEILSELKDGNEYLAKRLETKIEAYADYING